MIMRIVNNSIKTIYFASVLGICGVVFTAYPESSVDNAQPLGAKTVVLNLPVLTDQKPLPGALTPVDALRIVAKNSEEIKAAYAEMIADKSKMHEAARALMPRVFAENTQTNGKILENVGFEEKRYGLSFEHTLYASGNLWNTYKQAKKQFKAAQARLKKAEIEVFFNTIKAYYELVKASLSCTMYKDIYQETKNDLDATKSKLEQGLITEQEYLEVKTKFNQIDFQRVSAERERDVARYKLVRLLELEDESRLATLRDIDTSLSFEKVDLSLNDILAQALSNRPEIKAAGLMAEAAELGRRAAKEKDDWRVDISGFGGKSSSRYTSEPENFRNDWSAVLKVTKTFGACSSEGSYSKENTSPQLGQSDRTNTTTKSEKVGLFDNFSKYTRINSAEAEYKKALRDKEEAKRDVGIEAHEAFYDYKESLIRITNAGERVHLCEERLASEVYQLTINQIPLPQVMETRIKLADEKSLYVQSLVEYKIALCKLDKAVGVWGKFSKFCDITGSKKDN